MNNQKTNKRGKFNLIILVGIILMLLLIFRIEVTTFVTHILNLESNIANAVCGNDIKEEGEECDGSDLGGQTCTSLLGKQWTGTLACYGPEYGYGYGEEACKFNISGCYKEIIKKCSDACSSGAKECLTDKSYRECGNYDLDRCLEWSKEIFCEAGKICKDGECILYCDDECSPLGKRECLNKSSYRECGNYDLDKCLEWSSSIECEFGKVCNAATGICSIPECQENWICEEWKECSLIDGKLIKQRNCYDANSCDTQFKKPKTSELCKLNEYVSWTIGEEIDLTLTENEEILFTINEEEHSLRIIEIANNTVLIKIFSPYDIKLSEGEAVMLDIDKDGKSDILIRLERIEDNKAIVTMKKIVIKPAMLPTEYGKIVLLIALALLIILAIRVITKDKRLVFKRKEMELKIRVPSFKKISKKEREIELKKKKAKEELKRKELEKKIKEEEREKARREEAKIKEKERKAIEEIRKKEEELKKREMERKKEEEKKAELIKKYEEKIKEEAKRKEKELKKREKEIKKREEELKKRIKESERKVKEKEKLMAQKRKEIEEKAKKLDVKKIKEVEKRINGFRIITKRKPQIEKEESFPVITTKPFLKK
ncbi:MAG: hypothetical protein QW041_00010 [Candidatus Pacearchaeota archaeon]